ncbi:unnamed protein product [Urochloa humidicola]
MILMEMTSNTLTVLVSLWLQDLMRICMGKMWPIAGKKCKKAAPRKKVHKAEREKLKRDHLNDLFVELGNMLDRQNNGKACILTDNTRILRDLLVQVESLRKEHSNLQNEFSSEVLLMTLPASQ